jgi:hypothetical protein
MCDLNTVTLLDPYRYKEAGEFELPAYLFGRVCLRILSNISSSSSSSSCSSDGREQGRAGDRGAVARHVAFMSDLQLLHHLRASFFDSMGDNASTLRDCEVALCLDPTHGDTLELYSKASAKAEPQPQQS